MFTYLCVRELPQCPCSTGVTQVVALLDLLVLLRAFFACGIGSVVTFNHSLRTDGKYTKNSTTKEDFKGF